ncbi:hypothetical protein AHF37_05569 [Paragonimus kellicotti]|nr:hypothetical protein AHF37_05569 [Paragonimus kellicotti]
MAEGRPVALKTNSSFSAALRRGEHIILKHIKKWAAGQNKQRTIDKNTAKLEEETEDLHSDLVDAEIGKIMMQAKRKNRKGNEGSDKGRDHIKNRN